MGSHRPWIPTLCIAMVIAEKQVTLKFHQIDCGAILPGPAGREAHSRAAAETLRIPELAPDTAMTAAPAVALIASS